MSDAYCNSPTEFYHDENNEPRFRGIKVRNLAALFCKEENHTEYTLEQFKEWLRKVAPEDDWKYISEWGIYEFDCIALKNKEILDYLFQLGLNPIYIYIDTLDSIERYEKGLMDKYKYKDKMLKEAKELHEVCKKYMTEEDIRKALVIRDL